MSDFKAFTYNLKNSIAITGIKVSKDFRERLREYATEFEKLSEADWRPTHADGSKWDGSMPWVIEKDGHVVADDRFYECDSVIADRSCTGNLTWRVRYNNTQSTSFEASYPTKLKAQAAKSKAEAAARKEPHGE